MRLTRTPVVLAAALLVSGCRQRYAPPESPMPPNTILLSQMMSELSAQPGFREAVLHALEGNEDGKRGPALLTPKLVTTLREQILGQDWEHLDRFPGWTMRAVNPTVRVISRVAEKRAGENAAASNPGASAGANNTEKFLDLGPYPLDQEQTVSFDEPSTLAPFTTEGIVTRLGPNTVRGDGPNRFAPEHAESQRLADALNRLAANALDGAKPFTVTLNGKSASTPQELIAALAANGHEVTVVDARYFANFGHLHYKDQDVMMPFWIDTSFAVPGTGGLLGWGARPLLVPVSHAEYEWAIRSPKDGSARGPRINADVSYYFGVDGKSEWRTMDTLDQSWVLRRAAHTYTGAQALEVTRLTGLLTVAYMHQHQRRPDLPFGGYYTLGVCQDGVAAIEEHMTGSSTLFPNTADVTLFDDPRDAEVNQLIAAIPKDRGGDPPQPERVFGSLPADPGSDHSFAAITVPGLADDLRVSYAAWQQGKLERIRSRTFYWTVTSVTLAGAGVLIALLLRRRRS
jgi:hypothetical protein